MDEQKTKFDETSLFELKANHNGYRFCPRCSADLIKQELDCQIRMVCPDQNCGFVFYQNPAPAAGAIIIKDDAILLVKRSHPPFIDWWCIPAGFMEWEEHPSETTVREIKEETGLEIQITQLFDIYSGDDDPRTNAILILYLARVTGGKLVAGDDASDAKYFSFDALPDKLAFKSHHQALADYQKRFRSRS